MYSTSTRTALFVIAGLVFIGATSLAQVCPAPPAGFSGLNGAPQGSVNHNSGILNFFTGSDSSDAVNSDNVAEAYMGEPIGIQYQNTRVPAGSPFTIAYSIGVLQTPTSVPTIVDGDIWVDINNGPSNFFGLVDGLGFTRPFPDPLGTTPGPTNVVNLNVGVTVDPNALGACVTFQTFVQDPIAPAPFNLAVSNPILFGIAPTIRGMDPQIAPPGGLVQMDIPGQSSAGELIFFQPAGQLAVTNSSQQVTVPADAISGQVSGFVNVWNTMPSIDGINDWIVVTDSVVVPMAAGGSIATNPDPNLAIAGSRRATVTSTLPAPTGTSSFSVALNAGDIIDIEVYSTEQGNTKITDGLGNLLNPLATEGFDPFVTIQQANNLDPLVWEDPSFSQGPFNLLEDDNSGPANNAFLRWQAKWTDTYNIVVSNAQAAAFASGDFMINILVIPGAPCVQGFNTSGQPVSAFNKVNIVQQGQPVDLVCANLNVGSTYTVEFIPKAGAPFTTRSLQGVLCTNSQVLTVTPPAAGATDLDMGLHQVRLLDETSQLQGLIWDNSSFTPTLGVLPDLLSIIGGNVTIATTAAQNTTTGSIDMTGLNTTSLLFQPPAANAANLFNGFFNFVDPGGSTVMYAEALGVSENNNLLFDCVNDTDAVANGFTNNGIYNPFIRCWPVNLLNAGPFNEDDGVLPAPLFAAPMGIGFNAAIIDEFFPLTNPMGGVYEFFVDQQIVFGPPQNHACMINVVIK